jgi:hypothetical protein
MKLGTILRAIARPIVHVEAFEDAISIHILQDRGPGVLVCDSSPTYGYPPRAKSARLGGLHVRYWGRDTLVHPAPEAS